MIQPLMKSLENLRERTKYLPTSCCWVKQISPAWSFEKYCHEKGI